MMSTVGVELTSFINPDLTWKTVSKGNRSGTRRTRKPGVKSQTMGMGLAEKNARTAEDVAVSESEKLGVDVLGRRFSEKVESVPIKKRRFMFRSPSPPPPLAPYTHLEASGQHVDFQSAEGQNSGSNSFQRRRLIIADCFAKSTPAGIDDQKIPEVIKGVDDFSGIEILAAAACSDSIGNDVAENVGNPLAEESTQERIESSACAKHMEETTALLETACCSPKDSVNESKTKGPSFLDNSFAVLHESPSKDNSTAERSIPLPDDRLLWDLNLSMDAWPCDGGNVGSQKDASDNISVRSEELPTKDTQDIKDDTTNKVVSYEELQAKASDNTSVRIEELPTKDPQDIKDDTTNKMVSYEELQAKASDNTSVRSEELPTKDPQDIKDDTTNKVVSHEELQTEASDNISVRSEELLTKDSQDIKDDTTNKVVSYEELQTKDLQDVKNDTTNKVVPSDVDGCNRMISDLRTLPVRTDGLSIEKQEPEGLGSSENKTEHVTVPVVEVEKSLMSASVDTNVIEAVSMDRCLSHSPFPGSDKRTWVSEEDRETSPSTHNVGLNAAGCIPEAEVGKTVCEGVQVEEQLQFANPQPHANGPEEMDICQFSPKSEDMSISDDYPMEVVEQADGASSAYTAQADSVPHLGSEVLSQKSSRNCDATSGGGEFSTLQACIIYDNGPTSYLGNANLGDTPKESHDLAVSQDKELTVGMGNHSELQTDYDSQFEDGELRESDVQCSEDAEQVDYDTEFEEDRSFGFEAESGEQKLKVEIGSSSDVTGNFKYCEIGEASSRENSVNLKMRTVEVPNAETKKNDCLDGSNVKDYDRRVDISKVSKRELLSRVEGPLSSGAIQRSRSDNFDGSYPRAERESGSEKFMGRDRYTSHIRGRSPGGGHYFNPSANYWDSKRQHVPIYNGPYNFGRPRPKSIVESRGYPLGTDQAPSEASGVGRPDNRITRQFMGSSNGVYRPLLRRRSPVERDDSYGMHPRMPTVRDTSPDRNRFRRYPQGVSRGLREEYLRHIPDDSTEYMSRMPHRFGRRERSISPPGGRPNYAVPYRRTRSRSRSRSPIGWLLQRDRNEGSRRRSRSPDFRSDARIDRVRSPFTKRFAADYGEEFVSPPRSRISPQRNPGIDHLRGRKSPVRIFRQGQRFDQMRPIRRLNSDGCFRPMIRPRRFPDMAAGGKGCKYQGSEEDKHVSRYEMIHRVRRYDTDGAVRRFRYNAEDPYVGKNSLIVTNANGVSSRRPDDAPRTASEDRSFKMQP